MKYAVPDRYFETRFFTDEAIYHWPIHFAIITAYTDTADKDLPEDISNDDALHKHLLERYSWVKRITAVDNDLKNPKPAWAVNADWSCACDIGQHLGQEAIYFVADNTLNISYSDHRRKPYVVGSFLEKLTKPE
jgi:hypothetical protein